MSVTEHKRHAVANLKVAVITASDSRTPETDESGKVIRQMFETAGHQVSFYEILPDEPQRISAAIAIHLPNVDAVVVTGGTGISSRDHTADVVKSLIEKELEGFGEIFRMLSYNQIGSAAFMSRAIAGIRHKKFIAALPGSPGACKLAMEKLILPEIGHIAHLLKS
ncbi:MAG: molybdenum cofactor synthesis domain protein [Candidatus Binatus sp.]|jgi:molybdenum cofactor biosynthesis protein B|nr:molybdenum cofactor synthesis domain protein [Candidatus Binatus sp.]